MPGTDATRRAPLTAAGLAVLLVLALAGPAGAAQARKGTVVGAGADAVPGSYIVALKPSIGLPGSGTVTSAARRRSATTLAARYGGRSGYVYSTVVEGFAAEGLTAAEAARLAADPAVDRVYEDRVVEAQGEQIGAPWNLDRIDQRDLPLDGGYRYYDGATGHNVHAYVMDSGVNTGHEDFGGRATRDFDALGGDGTDCSGHGTSVASVLGGTTYGVAKAVRIHSVRVLGCDGSGAGSDALAGMDWVAANHRSPAVANFSASVKEPGESDILYDQAVERLIASGVTTVVAAGNDNKDVAGVIPARVPAALTAAATDSGDTRAGYSNHGAGVDLFAPGVDIRTAAIGSTNGTRISGGTSMAAPHVAGAAARYLQRDPNATPWMVANTLTGSATSGKVGNPGSGSPNLLLWSEGPPFVNPPPPTTPTPPPTTPPAPPGPDPAPQGSITVVSNTSVKGWAEDGSCGGDDPIKVQIEFDPPGDGPRQYRDTVEAGSPVDNHANHGFTYNHSFPVGSKVYATALGIGASCTQDGTRVALQGSGWEVPPPWSAGDPPPAEAATSFVPVAQYPGMTTGVQVLNSDTSAAKAVVHRVRGDGTPAAAPEDITVPAGGAKTLLDDGTGEAAAMLIEGKDGAAKLSTVNNHVLGGRASASNGFSRGTRQVHLPLLMRHHDNGKLTTWFAVQNTTREQAVIDITYSYMVPDPEGNGPVRATERGIEIPPLATRFVYQEDAPASPAQTLFSAEVLATKGLVAATVFEESAENLLEYSGIAEEQAATQVAVPLVMANNFGSWTGVQIMNVGDQAATISLTYGTNSADQADPAMSKGRCGDVNGTFEEGVMPGESANFLQRTGTAPEETSVFRDCTFVGSAWILSDQPVVAIINQVSPSGQSAYEGKPMARLTTSVRLPLVQVNNFGITGAVQIANQSLETVSATITFGPNVADEPAPGEPLKPGQLARCPSAPDPITYDGDDKLVRRSTRTAMLPDTTPKAAGCAYVGSVEASSTDSRARMAAMANQVMPTGTDRLLTYTAG